MEYLKNVDDKLKCIDENLFEFVDLMEHPELVFGTPNIVGNNVDFSKYSYETDKEILNYNESVKREYESLRKASSGCQIRFKSDSNLILFKIELRRKWDYRKLTLWSSSGFDVYTVKESGEYIHKTVFAPKTGENIFAEIIQINSEEQICIYLPQYNEIKAMKIGILKGKKIESFKYANLLPIIFYGNSITQGASASRSGNSFVNIVSRRMNCGILNFSTSSCCKGLLSVADTIGKINCSAIVIDYTRNAWDWKEFEASYDTFYKSIRAYHKNEPIILLTVSNFNQWKGYFPYDDVVKRTYKNAIQRKENTFLINQRSVFNEEEYDLVTIDGVHYTDLGMYIIAEKICEILGDFYDSI